MLPRNLGTGFWRAAAIVVLSLLVCNECLAQAADHDAQAIDKVWQDANRKFDRARGAFVQTVDRQASSGPFRPDWATLQKYRAPAWYENAKFGIFIHWGLYSVPAFANEWYSRNMYERGSREF